MPSYQLMYESAYDQPADRWFGACVWGYDGTTIQVRALPAYSHLEAKYAAVVLQALARGFRPSEIWAYQAEDGGDGYFVLRNQPVTVEAESLEAALIEALQRMLTVR